MLRQKENVRRCETTLSQGRFLIVEVDEVYFFYTHIHATYV